MLNNVTPYAWTDHCGWELYVKMDPIRPLITLGWGNSRGFMGCQAPAGDAHHYSPN